MQVLTEMKVLRPGSTMEVVWHGLIATKNCYLGLLAPSVTRLYVRSLSNAWFESPWNIMRHDELTIRLNEPKIALESWELEDESVWDVRIQQLYANGWQAWQPSTARQVDNGGLLPDNRREALCRRHLSCVMFWEIWSGDFNGGG